MPEAQTITTEQYKQRQSEEWLSSYVSHMLPVAVSPLVLRALIDITTEPLNDLPPEKRQEYIDILRVYIRQGVKDYRFAADMKFDAMMDWFRVYKGWQYHEADVVGLAAHNTIEAVVRSWLLHIRQNVSPRTMVVNIDWFKSAVNVVIPEHKAFLSQMIRTALVGNLVTIYVRSNNRAFSLLDYCQEFIRVLDDSEGRSELQQKANDLLVLNPIRKWLHAETIDEFISNLYQLEMSGFDKSQMNDTMINMLWENIMALLDKESYFTIDEIINLYKEVVESKIFNEKEVQNLKYSIDRKVGRVLENNIRSGQDVFMATEDVVSYLQWETNPEQAEKIRGEYKQRLHGPQFMISSEYLDEDVDYLIDQSEDLLETIKKNFGEDSADDFINLVALYIDKLLWEPEKIKEIYDKLGKAFGDQVAKVFYQHKYMDLYQDVAERTLQYLEDKHFSLVTETIQNLKEMYGSYFDEKKFVDAVFNEDGVRKQINAWINDEEEDEDPLYTVGKFYDMARNNFGDEIANRIKEAGGVYTYAYDLKYTKPDKQIQSQNKEARNDMVVVSVTDPLILRSNKFVPILKGGKLFSAHSQGLPEKFRSKIESILDYMAQNNLEKIEVEKILSKLSSDPKQIGEKEIAEQFFHMYTKATQKDLEDLVGIIDTSIEDMGIGNKYRVDDNRFNLKRDPMFGYTVNIGAYKDYAPYVKARGYLLVRIDLSEETLDYFKKYYLNIDSLHFDKKTLCWARIAVTNHNPLEWVISEMQSDMLTKLLKNRYKLKDEKSESSENTLMNVELLLNKIKDWQQLLMREVYRLSRHAGVKVLRMVDAATTTMTQGTNQAKTQRLYDDFAESKDMVKEKTPEHILNLVQDKFKVDSQNIWRVYQTLVRMVKIANALDKCGMYQASDSIDNLMQKVM